MVINVTMYVKYLTVEKSEVSFGHPIHYYNRGKISTNSEFSIHQKQIVVILEFLDSSLMLGQN